MRVLVLMGLLAIFAASACREEGPAERAGRQIDESVDEMTDAGDAALEKLGEKADEMVEETR